MESVQAPVCRGRTLHVSQASTTVERIVLLFRRFLVLVLIDECEKIGCICWNTQKVSNSAIVVRD